MNASMHAAGGRRPLVGPCGSMDRITDEGESHLARIPLPTLETMTAEQRAVYDTITAGPRGAPRGPLLAALHRPELADRWQQFGELLRYRTCMPLQLSEIAILTTARHWNCQLEWHIHEEIARNGGVDPAVIESIRRYRRPLRAGKNELAVYDYCVEMQQSKTVCDETYRKVLDTWGVVGVVELTALIGYYTMVAMTLNAHELPLPDGVAPPLDLPNVADVV